MFTEKEWQEQLVTCTFFANNTVQDCDAVSHNSFEIMKSLNYFYTTAIWSVTPLCAILSINFAPRHYHTPRAICQPCALPAPLVMPSMAVLDAAKAGAKRILVNSLSFDDTRATSISEFLPSLLVGLLTALLLYLAARGRPPPYISKQWCKYKVIGKRVVSEGPRPVVFFTVGVRTKDMPTGSHVKIRARTEDGEEVIKSYTPTRFDSDSCEIMIR